MKNEVQPGTKSAAGLEDGRIDVKLKLSALWASVMFCYIYADYFGLFVPGAMQALLAGKIGPFVTSQGVLVGTSAMMATPAVMIYLSLVMKPSASRWMNIVFGALYTIIIVLTTVGAWLFYFFYGAIEVVLTSLIVWYAWKWPKSEAA